MYAYKCIYYIENKNVQTVNVLNIKNYSMFFKQSIKLTVPIGGLELVWH